MSNMWLINPVDGERKFTTTPTIITVEIKWGRYVIVCVMRLNTLFLTSLNNKANMIGAGKPNIKPYRLIRKVLRTSFRAYGFPKKFLKCLNPTQGLPLKPLNGV